MKLRNIKKFGFITTFLIVGAFATNSNAHCDTMDGPTVIDGQRAMKENNINYALKWIQPNAEKELKEAFTSLPLEVVKSDFGATKAIFGVCCLVSASLKSEINPIFSAP